MSKKNKSGNEFVINYEEKSLTLLFEKETFNFNLSEGDVGDFWHSFTTKGGVEKDINFYQENEEELPSLTVYGIKDGYINTKDEIVVKTYSTIGNPKNYFG